MQDELKKLEAFTGAVEALAGDQAEEILSRLAREERSALDGYEQELQAESRRRIASEGAEAKADADKAITAATLSVKRQLLEFRESCGHKVYDAVLERLRGLPDTDSYDDVLSELLFTAVGRIPDAMEFTVYLRPQDMKYRELLSRAVPRVKLDFREGAFTLGGLIVESGEKNRRADMTLDSAFADVSGRFAELTGFTVEE